MVYCVGLTGNIASGKSTVAAFFEALDIGVLNADSISKQLTQKGAEAYDLILEHFGSQILENDRQLNRKKLRDIIFTNAEHRLWLEQLLHPLIRQQLAQEVESCTSPYCIVEIPLLKNKQNYPYLQRVLLVTSPIDTQIKRLMDRDGCSQEQALAIISTQPSNKERLAQADDVLTNKGDLNKLKTEVNSLHLKYLHLAQSINKQSL
ncbi:dephospho-CoA kinase [Legionella sp. km772]|uniref:dephospho-CoA kinase n=1 Tax=Legionella sp. km772 TaxID=2498111 RepID=UPI000F8E8708|nr:dephospho-CoA kinase [Legionella sp. km772]RUR12945.1 dephospho-CoA kinase [Legionella sp. km772]